MTGPICNRRTCAVLTGVLAVFGCTLVLSTAASAQVRVLVTDQASLSLASNITLDGNTAYNQAGDFLFASGAGATFLKRAGSSSIERLLQPGDQVPDIPHTRLDANSSLRVNASGLLCLQFDYFGGGVISNVILTYEGSTFRKIVAGSDVAPASGGSVFGRALSGVSMNDAGDITFTAPLIPLGSPSGTPVNTTLFIVPAGGVPVRVAGPGDTLPDTGGATIASLVGGTLNSQGEVLFRAALSSGGYGYYAGSVSGVRKIVAHGDPKPGGGTIDFSTLISLSTVSALLNNLGQAAVRTADHMVYLHTAASGPVVLFDLTTPVPAPLDSRSLTSISLAAFNDSGDVLFTGTLSGTSANNSAVFRYTPGNPLEILAYKGQAAPGTSGQTFNSLGAQVNAAGDLVITATLSPTTPAANGVFKKPAGGSLAAVVLHGQDSGLSGGGTFSAPGHFLLLADGSVYFESGIAGGTATYGCFVVKTGGIQTLVTDLEPLPAGSRVLFRTLYPIGAGNYVGFNARRAGSSDAMVVHNALTGVTSTVAAIGNPAPGGGTISAISNTDFVYVNASGIVIFGASVSGTSGYVFAWDAANGVRKILGPGDVEPSHSDVIKGAALLTSGYAMSLVNDAGQVAVSATFNTSGGSGIYVAAPGEALVKVVRANSASPYGEAAPSGGTFSSVSRWLINNAGQVACLAVTRIPDGTSAGKSSTGIYVWSPQSGTVQTVWASDPGSTVTLNMSAFDDTGRVVFFAPGGDGSTSLYVGSGGTTRQAIALTGAAAPSGDNYAFASSALDARINALGDIMFHAQLTGGSSDSGYFLRRARTGGIETVAVQGQAAPGTSSTFTTFIRTLNSRAGEFFALDPTGEALFRGLVYQDGVYTNILYRYRVSGVLERVIGPGEASPGSGGGTLEYISQGLGAGRPGIFFFRGVAIDGTYGDAIFATLITGAADVAGSGGSSLAVLRPSTATWYVKDQGTVTLGQAGDIPVVADYNGDGKAEIAVFRPSTGEWWIAGASTATVWGQDGDVPVPGDYNGDGKAEIAVFRPATGEWMIEGEASPIAWGMRGDVPAPADYDGDGTVELAVFRPTTGVWYVRGGETLQWGMWGDVPVPGDYNGDGKAEIAVFRPSTGWWYVARGAMAQWGAPGDMPVPLDVDGDGATEFVVYRPTTGSWYVLDTLADTTSEVAWGQPGDVPVGQPPQLPAAPVLKTEGDFDHDGSADVTVFRPSSGIWYTLESTFAYRASVMSVPLGQAGDVPLPGDYQGSGYQERAVYRPSTGQWLLEDERIITLGASGDVPVPADYDGDGIMDIAVFTPSSGLWSVLTGASGFMTLVTQTWGASGDVPAPGDYDGDGKTDLAVFTPATGLWTIRSSVTGTTLMTVPWGMSGDIPVPADYDGDGKTAIAVYRPSTGYWYDLMSGSGWSFEWDWWGAPGDVPVPGDYDGDGKADVAVFRPSTGAWYVMNVLTIIGWGEATDVPILSRR